VDGRDLDILVIPPPIGLLVFDAQVGEMDLIIEERKVVFVSPFRDLVRLAVGVAVVVIAVVIALMKPLLVLTLELVVEGHSIHACSALREAFGFSEVRAVRLGVVFHLARLLQTRVELLTMVVLMVLAMVRRVVTAVRLQHVPTLLRQHDRDVSAATQALGSDEPFLAEVSKVAGPRIGRTLVVVAEIACRDDPKRADRRQGAGFRAPQAVLAVPGIVDNLPVSSARKVEVRMNTSRGSRPSLRSRESRSRSNPRESSSRRRGSS
jgi:hypothetical protein